MSNLYQDAILDAKALRASAMANAKAALEEAFEPKIQEMLRLKLSEELDEVEELEEEQVEEAKEDIKEEDGVEEVKHDGIEEEYSEDGNMEENYDINEAELEEILAQLEELTATEADQPEMEEKKEVEMEEAEQLAENIEENLDEKEEEEEEEEEEEGETEEAEVVDDETKVIDITLGDLKQVLQSVMGGAPAMDMPSDEADSDSEAEAEVTLEEILAELENEGMEDAAHRDPGHEAGKQKPAYPELEEKKAKEDEKEEDDDKKKKMEEELEEAKTTIEKMRQDLQEVNLLNAKYLYMNKLFKSKSLSESQKIKVINALDRATNVNEVKNTYETLKESFTETKKTQLKESIGFASQAAGVAPKATIVDADPFINRWQTLAGIKK